MYYMSLENIPTKNIISNILDTLVSNARYMQSFHRGDTFA